MRFKVEIEARQANFELWILSTLVFIHSQDTLSRRSWLLSFQRTSMVLSTTYPFTSEEANASMFDSRLCRARWSVRGSNPRPPACKAGALPAELTPQKASWGLPRSHRPMRWAWKDLNFRPHAYQACALT